MKKITVIVPVYNVEKYLHVCLDSLLGQAYQNLEIIVVDDGSTDDSGKICDEYGIKDERVHVFHKKNGGISDARNYGLKYATGDLIGFVDSDDYVDTDFFQELYNEMMRTNADIVECASVSFQDGSIPRKKELQSKKVIYKPEEWLTETGLGSFISCVVWNKLYKKTLFENIEFPVGRHYEDEATTYKLIYRANYISRINLGLYYYRQRINSITSVGVNLKEVKDKYFALAEKIDYFKECNEISISNFATAKLLIYMISVYKYIDELSIDRVVWYRFIKEKIASILFEKIIPLKYKLYILGYLVFPIIFRR